MSRLLKELLATAAMMACETSMLGKTPYHKSMGTSDSPKHTSKYKLPVKELREFTIKGKTIMATSRKDAIKKYNHKYK